VANKEKKNVFELLENVHNLPSMPIVLAEVNNILYDHNASATDLAEIVSKDQGLVTKILTVANSPLFGIPRRVSTIEFAIVILGFNQIKNIVIALSMMEAFKKISGKKFHQKKYWTHSVLTAFLSKKIADDLGYSFSGEAFTSGLLHDLGLPLIFQFFPDEFGEIIDRVNNGEGTYLEIEKKVLGATHCEIGKFLVDKWNLPESLSEAVLHHHDPNQENIFRELTSVVHLADYLLNNLKIGDYFWDTDIVLDKEIFNILKIGNEEFLNNFIDKYEPLLKEQAEVLIF